VSEAREKLGLSTLKVCRRELRVNLYKKMIGSPTEICTKFLKENTNPVNNNVTTCFQSQGLVTSLSSNSGPFYHSFLPRTIRDIRLEVGDEQAAHFCSHCFFLIDLYINTFHFASYLKENKTKKFYINTFYFALYINFF